MNGAGVVAEVLKREGTEFLSCYPRNQVIEPCAALDIRPILCRQERVGGAQSDVSVRQFGHDDILSTPRRRHLSPRTASV